MVTTERVAQVSARQAWGDPEVRRRYGYPVGRSAVLTDLCVMEPTGEAGRLQVASLHPGVDFEQVRAATGFDVELAQDWRYTEAPTDRELAVLREEVGRWMAEQAVALTAASGHNRGESEGEP